MSLRRLSVLLLVFAVVCVFAGGAHACCAHGSRGAPHVSAMSEPHPPAGQALAPKKACVAVCGVLAVGPLAETTRRLATFETEPSSDDLAPPRVARPATPPPKAA